MVTLFVKFVRNVRGPYGGRDRSYLYYWWTDFDRIKFVTWGNERSFVPHRQILNESLREVVCDRLNLKFS